MRLSRGSPWDDLTLLPHVWHDLDGRWGPHTVDRYASSESALLPRFNSLLPHEQSEGAGALSQSWVGENNFVFPPPSELLPRALARRAHVAGQPPQHGACGGR